MLDFAWPELVVIGGVALLVLGPEDWPKAMHTMGRWASKARTFVHDLTRAMEQASYEAEIAEKLKKQKEEDPPPPPAGEKP